ncbi:hypothetical protein BJ508DRAFT_314233 [Ascobolus immersus RN42]|uniref:Uncharacterized protein n=1 Tax=Ascobolus immersus RN42 TaxID=1160509 RepID=A0A3N4HJ52_ASCIM|nr:hypothetical protein BJ508DRAFT_314233 [Ascobolus immersus RN42]
MVSYQKVGKRSKDLNMVANNSYQLEQPLPVASGSRFGECPRIATQSTKRIDTPALNEAATDASKEPTCLGDNTPGIDGYESFDYHREKQDRSNTERSRCLKDITALTTGNESRDQSQALNGAAPDAARESYCLQDDTPGIDGYESFDYRRANQDRSNTERSRCLKDITALTTGNESRDQSQALNGAAPDAARESYCLQDDTPGIDGYESFDYRRANQDRSNTERSRCLKDITALTTGNESRDRTQGNKTTSKAQLKGFAGKITKGSGPVSGADVRRKQSRITGKEGSAAVTPKTTRTSKENNKRSSSSILQKTKTISDFFQVLPARQPDMRLVDEGDKCGNVPSPCTASKATNTEHIKISTRDAGSNTDIPYPSNTVFTRHLDEQNGLSLAGRHEWTEYREHRLECCASDPIRIMDNKPFFFLMGAWRSEDSMLAMFKRLALPLTTTFEVAEYCVKLTEAGWQFIFGAQVFDKYEALVWWTANKKRLNMKERELVGLWDDLQKSRLKNIQETKSADK